MKIQNMKRAFITGAVVMPLLLTAPRAGATDFGGSSGQIRLHHHHDDDDHGGGEHHFTGRVTLVTSRTAFDVEINGRIYNVFCDGRLPRDLNRDDIVDITGDRDRGDDINNAHVDNIH